MAEQTTSNAAKTGQVVIMVMYWLRGALRVTTQVPLATAQIATV